MKKFILLSIFVFFLSGFSFAKDINAWKQESNLEQQYLVFKENLNFWNGNYFLNETQLNEFYAAFRDSVVHLENDIKDKKANINELQNELNLTNNRLEETKSELETSIKNRNSITVFGQKIDKSIYTLIMSLLIFGLLVFVVVLYLLFKRSHKVTVKTRKEYDELKQEFEVHKKNALERYTKINMELHQTRMELNKR